MPRTPQPPLPDISIRQLEYLVAVADASTWKAAAGELGVSPSALSQGLAELERRVGVALFEAQGRRRLLRATAQPVLDHARRVVTSTTDLVEWSQRIRSSATGTVRLGMIDVAAVTHFPDVLRAFRTDFAEVELTLSVAPSQTLFADLERGTLDLAVGVAPPVIPQDIEVVALLSEPLVIYGPPDCTIGAPSTWGPWVLFPTGSHTRRAVDERLAQRGARLDVVAESHQPDVLREMVMLGLGWTVLPRSQGEIGAIRLTPGEQLLKRGLVLARRSAAVVDPAVDELAKRLRRRPDA